jgi:hypothetical protein
LLAPARLRAQGLISSDFRERYLRPHLEGTADYTNRVWAMLMFQLWYTSFSTGAGTEPPAAELRHVH